MRLEKVTSDIFSREYDSPLFSPGRFRQFIQAFNVTRWEDHAYEVTKNVDYFARWVSTVGLQARRRRGENIPHYVLDDGDGTRNYGTELLLFDHVDAFESGHRSHFIVSMPYASPQMSMDALARARALNPQLNDIKMHFLPHEFKYRKNGDFMLLFCRKDSTIEHMLDSHNLLSFIPDQSDDWSNN